MKNITINPNYLNKTILYQTQSVSSNFIEICDLPGEPLASGDTYCKLLERLGQVTIILNLKWIEN